MVLQGFADAVQWGNCARPTAEVLTLGVAVDPIVSEYGRDVWPAGSRVGVVFSNSGLLRGLLLLATS